MKKVIVLICIIVLVLLVYMFQRPTKTFVTIGTGGVTGVYYPTGGAIQRMINKKFKQISLLKKLLMI